MEREILYYLDHLRRDGRKENTINAYLADLRHFCAFLREGDTPILRWEDVGEEAMTRYLHALAQAGRSPATLTRRRAVLSRFLHFLGNPPAPGLPALPPGTLHTPPRPSALLTPEEVAALFAHASSSAPLFAQRDRALLELLYDTGARISALTGLNVADVHLERREIFLAESRQATPIGPSAAAALADYLAEGRGLLVARATRSDQTGGALFLNHLGRRLTRQGAWLIVSTCAAACGIEKSVTPRSLRRSREEHTIQESSLYLY